MKRELLEIIKKYNQVHLLKYYDELDDDGKANLEKQIESIDFSLVELIGNNKQKAEKRNIQPIEAVTKDDIEKSKDKFFKVGIDAVKSGKVGAVLLAGGQGTRLGFDKPKGMFNIGVTKNLYIFQCLVNNLLEVVKKADSWVHLFVMTSEKNNDDTISFFEEHDYFGYNKDYISFFIQEMNPSSDFEGKILLEEKGRISLSPNGNGGWYSSLKKAGLDRKIKDSSIEWLNVFAVDNVLQKIADPCFIGAVISEGYKSGSKVVRKVSPEEKVGVLCLENGKPSIVEYYEMTEDMRNLRNSDGTLSYSYGVILNYLFRTDSLEKCNDEKMPVHIVEKKIPYINENGEIINPEIPNGYKFETLVLDMVHMQENCLAYEVDRNKEFAPVKNKDGVDSVESARNLLQQNGIVL